MVEDIQTTNYTILKLLFNNHILYKDICMIKDAYIQNTLQVHSHKIWTT